MRTLLLPGLACLLGLTPALAQQSSAPAAPPQIVVTGQGEVRLTPDRAIAEIAVETRAPTAVEAGEENARRMAAVRAALLRAGVASEAISGAGYSVQANVRYEQGTERQEGYRATSALHVETRQLDRLGAIIDAALAAGANRIQSVRFTTADTEQGRRRALAAAITRARADAEAMAQAAGGRLGSLLEISTVRFDPAPGVYEMAARVVRDDATSITPTELVLRANVLTRWRLFAQ